MSRALTLVVAVAAASLSQGAGARAEDLGALRAAIDARYAAIEWIGAAELLAASTGPARPRPVLLDARSRAEYDVSHLSRAVWVDPDRFDPEALAAPRDAPIVVYCSVGWRSAAVVDRLRDAGFTDVRNLEGGIFGWANEGRPVFRGGERVREVHPYDDAWGRLLRPELRARR